MRRAKALTYSRAICLSTDMLKYEIKNYTSYVRYKARLLNKLDELWYELSGVKGVRYDKAPATFNPSLTEEKKHALMERIDLCQGELSRVNIQIDYIDTVLDRLNKEDLEMVKYVLVEGHTLDEAGEKWYLTGSAISKRIDAILRKAVETTFKH